MDSQELKQRGNWGSKLAFIFAASGSAIGLGSIWRFPLMVGLNGGAVFVFTYIIAVFFIGFTVMLAEFVFGRHTAKNPVGAYKAIRPGTPWKWAGYLGVTGCACILSYYGVVAGWAFGYFYKTIAGKFKGDITWQVSDGIFKNFAADPVEVLFCLLVIIGITTFVISKGVKGGIERFAKVLMPLLFGLIIILAVRAVTLPGAGQGLAFYLKPDLSKLSPKVLFFAVGQAFFSLSIGVGTMITYASYLSKKDNLVSSAGWVCFSTTLVAFLTGIIIFPTLFATPGISPENFEVSTGLMFQVFPMIISKLPGGAVFGFFFFFLILVAALTSTISMLEVPVAYFVDEKNWSRKKASYIVGISCFLLGIPSGLSQGGVPFLTKLGFFAKMDLVFGNIVLALGGLAISIFLSYVWKIKNAIKEISFGNTRFRLKPLWVFNIKFLAPVAIIIILVFIRTLTG
ncbi:MAG: sodium-dependent transporter [Candidatus Aminicenantes bacterium]|nr:sodium-dependent transporter [Candidatus Aminicenantes bacterium]